MTDKPTPPPEGQVNYPTVSDPSRDAFERFVGLLLMVIGALWSFTTGLFTLIVLFAATPARSSDVWAAIQLGIPLVLFGAGMFMVGRWLKRKDAAPPPEPPSGTPSE